MGKLLESVITKAIKTGYANKNGRKRYYQSIGNLESQWEANFSKQTGHFDLSHWGTQIIALNLKSGVITDFYGQSKSDRDAICQVFNHFGLSEFGASYHPSIDKFTVWGDFGTGKIIDKSI